MRQPVGLCVTAPDLQRRRRGQPMPDIRIVQNTWFPRYSVTCDWNLLSDGTLDDTQALATAIIVALGTNALAQPDDELPGFDGDMQGWWGNLDAELIWGGWPIGSRLWELKLSKITGTDAIEGATVTRVEQYIREAIQPFIQRRIGSAIYVEATRVGLEQIVALVRIYRGPMLEIELQYQILWDEIPQIEPPSQYAYNIGRLRVPEI
jgi:phage gp46-like protein